MILKEIEKKVKKQFIIDRYKAVLEQIESYNLQKEYLMTQEGRHSATAISGEIEIDNLLKKIDIILEDKKAEKKFLEGKINGKI